MFKINKLFHIAIIAVFVSSLVAGCASNPDKPKRHYKSNGDINKPYGNGAAYSS